ncbi:MAG: response regulator [Pseudomonadota bacterium]
MQILIVEDDDGLRQFLTEVFEGAGHEVTGANGAAAARKALLTGAVDVMVTDLFLGADSGLPLATLAMFTNPDCKIIVITGTHVFPNGELFEIEPSVWKVMRKPVAVDELLALSEHAAAA